MFEERANTWKAGRHSAACGTSTGELDDALQPQLAAHFQQDRFSFTFADDHEPHVGPLASNVLGRAQQHLMGFVVHQRADGADDRLLGANPQPLPKFLHATRVGLERRHAVRDHAERRHRRAPGAQLRGHGLGNADHSGSIPEFEPVKPCRGRPQLDVARHDYRLAVQRRCHGSQTVRAPGVAVDKIEIACRSRQFDECSHRITTERHDGQLALRGTFGQCPAAPAADAAGDTMVAQRARQQQRLPFTAAPRALRVEVQDVQRKRIYTGSTEVK